MKAIPEGYHTITPYFSVQGAQALFADEVTVHYNPEDPSESSLLQTPKVLLYIVIVASCLAITYGLMFLLIKRA
jgi:ABC-type uncharacterized transport system permease subunit